MEEIWKPKVVLCLIEKDGNFVLIKRKVPAMKVTWAFPGGVTEKGEAEEQSVIREARQEVGLDVAVKEKLLDRKHPNTYVEIGYFYCVPTDSKQEAIIGEPEEIEQVEWVAASEVLGRFTSDVHPKIKGFVESKVKR